MLFEDPCMVETGLPSKEMPKAFNLGLHYVLQEQLK